MAFDAPRLLQVVGKHMCMQVAFLVEAFMAGLEGALEGLFACMDAQMRLQVEVQGEPLATDFALVWFFPLKLVSEGLKLITVWTSMWRLSFALSRNFFPQFSKVH